MIEYNKVDRAIVDLIAGPVDGPYDVLVDGVAFSDAIARLGTAAERSGMLNRVESRGPGVTISLPDSSLPLVETRLELAGPETLLVSAIEACHPDVSQRAATALRTRFPQYFEDVRGMIPKSTGVPEKIIG